MARRLDALLGPPALGALALLLLNDFVLKAAFPGALTGKLSDFAGLFLFAVFWSALFPRHRAQVALLAAAGFVLWKSPLAQPAIDAWNALGPFPVARVVDPTDLVALLVLPLACAWRPGPRVGPAARRLLGPAAAAMCFFAFAATSRALPQILVPDATYDFPFSRAELLRRIYELRLSYEDLGTPPEASPEGPDRFLLSLPPVGTPRQGGHDLDAVLLELEASSTPTGSALYVVSAGSFGARLHPDSVRAAFERRVVEPLRRGEAATVHAGPETAGRDEHFRPRVLSPAALTEPRGRVTVSLARPAYVALVEVTPEERWHLIYPTGDADNRLLPAGTHTLVTTCASSTVRPIPPEQDVPVCGVARPVRPEEVRLRTASLRHCTQAGPPRGRVVWPGKLMMLAAEKPIRREELARAVEGRCLTSLMVENVGVGGPLHILGKRADAGAWAGAEYVLRR
ncbi:MAG TPA: hypothetical protein VF746_14005 [Longimicrobium sp.]|jgi:hypothetical protein